MGRRGYAGLVVLTTMLGLAQAQPVRVGDTVSERVETSHPYTLVADGGAAWQHTFHRKGASYVAVHFERFELAEGDRVVIADPLGRRSVEYRGRGKGQLGTFWATHVPGDTATVTLYTHGVTPAYGLSIDRWAHGFPSEELRGGGGGGPDTVCGTDDSDWAQCYLYGEPELYERGRAVARLLTEGVYACTGWLVGCEGHLITNHHCIAGPFQASNTDYEFVAERGCETACDDWFSCPGHVVASSATFVRTSAALDYTLVRLPSDPTPTYGFLTMREDGAELGERMYTVGHPRGGGKRVSLASTSPNDPEGYCSVQSISETACRPGGPPDVGYECDTDDGSSGGPVIGYDDHQVIALHHCGNCPNRGVPIQAIVDDLGEDLPACSLCVDPPGEPHSLTATSAGEHRVELSWSTGSPPGDTYNVYRKLGSCSEPGRFSRVASGLSGPTYVDEGVSGGRIWSYEVSAAFSEADCVSNRSSCVEAAVTGSCLLPPGFDGLTRATLVQEGTHVAWDVASPLCGPETVYNVYRSTDPEFEPGARSLVAACVSGTEFVDTTNRFPSFYLVRAEDLGGSGAGACAGGTTDANLERRLAAYVSTDVPKRIRDYQTVTSVLWLPPGATPIDVDVHLDITHSYAADLEVVLQDPIGNEVPLFYDVGHSGNDFLGTELDDEADVSIVDGSPPFTGTFRPMSPLSGVDCRSGGGWWRLYVTDDALQDMGELEAWSMEVRTSGPETCDGLDNDCDGTVDEGFDDDGDGHPDCTDVCPVDADPGQEDGDGDGVGDACELTLKVASPDDALPPGAKLHYGVRVHNASRARRIAMFERELVHPDGTAERLDAATALVGSEAVESVPFVLPIALDAPAGDYRIDVSAHDKLTGELLASASMPFEVLP